MFILGKNIEALNNSLKEPVKKKYYEMKDAKEIVNLYITENELD